MKVARADAPSELIICRMDSTIEDKRTYSRVDVAIDGSLTYRTKLSVSFKYEDS